MNAFEKQIKGFNDAILMGEESDEVRTNLEGIMKMEEIDGEKADL